MDARANPNHSARVRERHRTVPGYAAQQAENRKRNATHEPGGATTEARLRTQGIRLIPIGFDTSGTPGREWSKFIKTLAGIAHTRRQHNPTTFTMKWNLHVSILLAHRGAEVARSRAAVIAGRHAAQRLRRNADWDDGPLGAPHAADLFTVPDRGA